MEMSVVSCLILVSIVLAVSCSVAEQATEFTEATDGGTASLPCNLTASPSADRVSDIIWYKGTRQTPIYRADLRPDGHQDRVDPELADRYSLRVIGDHKAELTISPLHLDDEELFHCRVDFYNSQTRYTHVNLTVTVPPSGVQVSDDYGVVKNGLTTAYAEGASLILTCTATGGKPLANVSWWHNGKLIIDETQYFPDRRKSQCILKIEKLTRAHLLAVYSCEVSNTHLQPPLVVRVAIDMYLRPLDVALVGNNSELSAGKRYNITCRCRGSRPPPIITWWKDGVSLEGGIMTVSADGNTTTSTLAFVPTATDHGLILTCKASNQRIPFSEQQRTWMLRVLYLPKVTLTLGHGLDANDIREGADVYFECHLVANPWVRRVWWLRNNDRLLSNSTAGIIVSNQTLVLQGVSRSSSGRYCCEATNSEGTGRSPSFHLRVKFEPVCGDGVARKVLGAAKDEPLRVECKVDSEPSASVFRWSFNSTPGISRELSEYTTEAGGGGSVLTYTPRQAADYGTLQCWGRNELGLQRAPCTYHIVPAGRPDAPHNCHVRNATHHSVLFVCKKGFDGGLKQKFTILVSNGDEVITNRSSNSAEFNLTGLEAAQDYQATVYSYNSKGWSGSSPTVAFRTLPAPGLKEQRRSTGPTEGEKGGGVGPWLYIVLAAGSTLIVAGAVGAIVFVVRRFRAYHPRLLQPDKKQSSPKTDHLNLLQLQVETPRREHGPRSPKLDEGPSDARLPAAYTDPIADDNNPDLIPPTNESLLDPSLAPYTISARPSSKRNCATQMPVKPYHVTWAPILQSRNCATQTPPPHKESSV